MSQLQWFTPPRAIASANERRRFARYPAGLSLRGRLALPHSNAPAHGHIHTISTAGVSLVVDGLVDVDSFGTLTLDNVDRAFRCTLRVRVCYVVPYRGYSLAGGPFDRELSREELERLTPTLSPWLEVEPDGDVLVGRFTRADLGEDQAVRVIGEQLFGLVEELGQRRFVLNFEQVERVNCSLLSQLIEFRRRVCQLGGRLALCNLDPLVQHIFETTLLTRVFQIYPSQRDAIRSFNSVHPFEAVQG
jgi:anti-sigma B factor antagonist